MSDFGQMQRRVFALEALVTNGVRVANVKDLTTNALEAMAPQVPKATPQIMPESDVFPEPAVELQQ